MVMVVASLMVLTGTSTVVRKSVPDSTALLFVRPGKPPLANPLYKAVLALNRVVSFDPLTGTQLNAFLQKRAKDNGIVLDESAANRMIAFLGSDLGALENTLLLLGAYVLATRQWGFW